MRSYPPARTGNDVDDYHGEPVSDPYRWLENTDDPETAGWIKSQNELTEGFLSAVPAREAIRARLTELWDYPKYGVPFERGGRWFQSRNSGLAPQPVLYVMDAPDGQGRPLLDPNVLATDGTVALSEINVNDAGTLLAYATSDMGSDWQTWRVRDVTTGADLDDKIEWSKFCEAAWRPDGSGFFYGAVEPATPGAEYLEANPPVRIYFHRIGTQQDDDQFVFAAAEPDWSPFAVMSDDGTVSFTESGSLWSHQLSTGQTTLIRPSSARIDPDAFVTEQVLAPSADGTPIPLFLTRRRDLVPDGNVPVLLYAYGGFDIAITPQFSATWAAWLDRGGLLAVANLRGGGEFGHAWHEAGLLDRKQNVFDDFCGCARWLADSGWSRPDRIAISGASNGGLLVGACLTQRPELFGACVADVGVFDMLRFPKFTIGWAWTGELGDPDDPEQYRWLRGYSPLHNIRAGTRYPPTLLLTGDHDDRVVPGHSFKFAAALQAAQGGDAPVLIRVETGAGHGAGKPTGKAIAAGTDVLAFLDAVLGPSRGSA